MMTKAELIQLMNARGVDTAAIEGELGNFEQVAESASKVRAAMPGIGFGSASKRINCFMAVCRHLDSMVDDGELDPSEAQLVLNMLRLKEKKFQKAISMFDHHRSRYGARERAEMPRSARQYLAAIEMFG